MKNLIMKKRIMALAASAVMSVSAVAGTATTAMFTMPAIMSVAAADSSVTINATIGYDEGMYSTWGAVSGASGYNVYVDGKQIDSMLIRQYSGYMRADMVGLKAGNHTMKIVPVINGKEDTSKASEGSALVNAHDRSGFGFVGGTSSGAYNDDGTLKSDAVVLYITNDTKDTVKMDVSTSSKGTTTSCTGVQEILGAYQKGYESRPLCLRFIGNVTDPAKLEDGDLLVKGNGASKRISCGITVEGIGSDATFNGFGLRIANASNVEVRNLGFMNCNSGEGDDVGLQQNNDHVWVHHCDFFYGDAGSDADQVKGDGALDTKTSSYITHSYNHFWDNGKCNLQGMKSETTENYITYHHNWYDHSDSRHPRIRTCSVHSYNNYFDGNAKYGVGVTMGASCFVESNYFRNCKYPMLISMQGSDVIADWATLKRDEKNLGTFSSEDGGVIKSYGNIIEGAKTFVTYQENNTEFDAYEVSSKSDTVPSSVKSYQGGKTYNNFDTSSIMYSYTPHNAADVPSIVTANAGRVDGGDFKWTFDNSVDDESYSVNQGLKNALVAYDDSIVAIGSGFKDDNSNPPTTTPTTQAPVVTTTASTTQAPVVTTTQTPVVGTDVIYASPNGKGDGKSANSPTDVLTAIKSVKAGGTIYLLEGTYEFSEMITIDASNSGAAGAYKTISAYPGAKVVWDFSKQGAADAQKRGVALRGNYWHFYGFEITKAADNGMILSGSNNKLEMMVFNDNQDTGLQISRFDANQATIDTWPSNNLILNCTSKNNCDDATMENADGFAAKLTCGEGNVFDGCMSYNNSDDGWDLFAKTETGPIGVVTLKNCVAFRNGFTEFGEGYGDCDGNGFKLGGSGVGSAHIVDNCLAFENLNCGFTDNNNPKLGKISNSTAINNGGGGNGKPNFSVYRCTNCDFDNLMSYYDVNAFFADSKMSVSKPANDKYVGMYNNGIYYNSGYYQVTSDTAVTNGAKIGTKLSSAPPASAFVSTAKAPAQGTDFHTAWRNADGSVNTNGFFETKGDYKSMGYHFKAGSAPVVTTPTTASTSKPSSSTTTTATTPSTPVSGGNVHDFTANGTNSSFYTITGNLSTSKGTVNYDGKTLTQCLKMESATNISFNATSGGKLVLVFVEPAATIKVDGTKYTSSGDGIITVDVAAGSHTITKADTANLFYIVYSEGGAPVSTTESKPVSTTESKPTETTPSTTGKVVAGDANCDDKVNMADATFIVQHCGNKDKYKLSEQGEINADVDGKAGISGTDALEVQKYVAGIVTSLSVAK